MKPYKVFSYCFLCVACFLPLAGCLSAKSQVQVPRQKEAAVPPVVVPQPVIVQEMRPEFPDDGDTISAVPVVKESAFPVVTRAPAYVEEERVVLIEKVVLPDIMQVKARLDACEERRAKWESLAAHLSALDAAPAGWQDCFTSLQHITGGYRWLYDRVRQGTDVSVGTEDLQIDPWNIYWTDIAFYEGGCRHVFEDGVRTVADMLEQSKKAAADEREGVVGLYAESGRFVDAVAAYEKYLEGFADWSVSPETQRIYAHALIRAQRFDEAAQEILASLDGIEDEVRGLRLRRLAADLLLATGQVLEARKQYKKLDEFYRGWEEEDRWVADHLSLLSSASERPEELVVYMSLLKSYISFDGRRLPPGMKENVDRLANDFPDSPVTNHARQILWKTEDTIKEWADQQLDMVDSLVDLKEFHKAVTLLEGLLAAQISAATKEIVQDKLDRVVWMESEDKEAQRLIMEQNLSQQWEKALGLLDLRRYDEAIVAFSPLLKTVYDKEAGEKIKDAANLAASDMRQQAAALFVQARKEHDPARKNRYLLGSWRLLKQIFLKYPDAEIIGKVSQNLRALETQINKIDPDLLENARVETESLSREDESGPVEKEDFSSPVVEEEIF